MTEFTAIDFETVPGPHGPEAAELGIIVFNETGQILHYYEAAAPVNELYASSPACKESIVSTWPDIQAFIQNKILVGHNLGYDFAILKKCFPGLNVSQKIDTGEEQNHRRRYCTFHGSILGRFIFPAVSVSGAHFGIEKAAGSDQVLQ